MNLRLMLWTVGVAIATVLFAYKQGSLPGATVAAAIFGAVLGYSLGNIFDIRAKRKHG